MERRDLADLAAFLAVAEERNFTRAAAKLGTSQSALSHTVRRLEERLGLQLLVRSTRSVSPTDAGERLIETLRPAFNDIDAKLAMLSTLREKPAGTIRVTTSQHAADTILWPKLSTFLPDYPDIHVELSIDQALTDIVTERFHAGVRLGEQVAKDMISVRIGPDLRMLVVGAPSYFAERGKPETPHDLVSHDCINLRFPTKGGLYAWEFEKNGHELNVRVDGRLVFNVSSLSVKAALAGLGLAYVMEDRVARFLEEGALVSVLGDWSPPFPGYHLYYPSRRQQSSAFALVVDRLRWREGNDAN